jgi:hypothetical protein
MAVALVSIRILRWFAWNRRQSVTLRSDPATSSLYARFRTESFPITGNRMNSGDKCDVLVVSFSTTVEYDASSHYTPYCASIESAMFIGLFVIRGH